MPFDHAARRARLRAALEVDALLVAELVDVRYLTGFTGSSGVLLVDGDGELLVTDGRYAEQAAAEAPDVERRITRGLDWLPERVGGAAVLGLAPSAPWGLVREVRGRLDRTEVVPVADAVLGLRQRKDDDEIAALRRACAITVTAFTRMLGWLRPGLTEREVSRRVLGELFDAGADDRAFELIVAAGPNGARPHHRPTDRVLERGDVVTFDIGALVEGYHADFTRNVALGEPPAELRRLHGLVREAQRAGRAAVGAGVPAADVDAACRAPLAAAGHGEHFPHGTGHGVGLVVHEPPILRPGAAGILSDRMAVTVEPGLYVPGLGGVRIEDLVVVGPDGASVLTAADHDLVVL